MDWSPTAIRCQVSGQAAGPLTLPKGWWRIVFNAVRHGQRMLAVAKVGKLWFFTTFRENMGKDRREVADNGSYVVFQIGQLMGPRESFTGGLAADR